MRYIALFLSTLFVIVSPAYAQRVIIRQRPIVIRQAPVAPIVIQAPVITLPVITLPRPVIQLGSPCIVALFGVCVRL